LKVTNLKNKCTALEHILTPDVAKVVLCIVSWRLRFKLSLCLTKDHAMKTYWGVEV